MGALIQQDRCPYKMRMHVQTDAQGESYMAAEAETGAMRL